MEARDSFCFPKNIKKPNLSPIGKKFGFCSEKHPLHGLKPCKIRAETVHLLSDKQNRPIPYRLDGIGLSDRTSKSSLGGYYYDETAFLSL